MDKHTHIGVYGLILNEDKILLIKKARGPYIGKYDLPGGKIEFGETQLDALKREIYEETGLCSENIKLMDGISNRVKWKKENGELEDLHHIGFIYKVDVEAKNSVKDTFDGHDSLGAKWVLFNSANKDILTPFAYNALLSLKNETTED